jgi:hypothetical protein
MRSSKSSTRIPPTASSAQIGSRSPLTLKMSKISVFLSLVVVMAACSSSKHSATEATTTVASTSTTSPGTAAPTSSTTGPPTTSGQVTTTGQSTTTTQGSSNTTVVSAANFPAISGTYVGGTADGGSVYIRSDGASRFRSPDFTACPSCSTAASPIADLDFSLTSLNSEGGGTLLVAGHITAVSDPTWAAQISPSATVGAAINAVIYPNKQLKLSILPGNDLLNFASSSAPYSGVAPCSVAAVTPAVVAHDGGTPTRVVGVTCSVDGEWASASLAVGSGAGEDDAVGVLASNIDAWYSADRPTVCNHHDITPSFYETACGSD